jgi:hypothetical protein
MAEEAFDPSQPALAGRTVRNLRDPFPNPVGRDGLDRRAAAQEAAEVGQVAAVAREGVGRCPIDLGQRPEECADFRVQGFVVRPSQFSLIVHNLASSAPIIPSNSSLRLASGCLRIISPNASIRISTCCLSGA